MTGPRDAVDATVADRSVGTGLVAAADLGSNSFHLVVARQVGSSLVIVDRVKDMVRLAEGLRQDGGLKAPVRKRALACLERFGQRLRGMPGHAVRIVGTNTLRQLPDDAFLGEAEAALGHPIDIVSGVEEARLVYLGAAHSLADDGARRLVVDIGGGSTELIIGANKQARQLDSLYMGCVAYTTRFFPDGVFSRDAWRRAEEAAQLELEPIVGEYHRRRWDEAIGTSGTIRAVLAVVQAQGGGEQGISRAALAGLRQTVLKAGRLDALRLPGLTGDRKPVFAAGLAILMAVFELLDVDRMSVADGALREGVLHDLLGRIRDADVRDASVRSLAERYHVDLAHADQVSATARQLLDDVETDWMAGREDRQLLRWAASLHEIGLDIAHSQYHRHGEYIVRHADIAGFSRQLQAALAALVRSHRRKLPLEVFDALPQRYRKRILRLALLLRLAVLLHRGRGGELGVRPRIHWQGGALRLMLPADWLRSHPLTRADLAEEVGRLAVIGLDLRIEPS